MYIYNDIVYNYIPSLNNWFKYIYIQYVCIYTYIITYIYIYKPHWGAHTSEVNCGGITSWQRTRSRCWSWPTTACSGSSICCACAGNARSCPSLVLIQWSWRSVALEPGMMHWSYGCGIGKWGVPASSGTGGKIWLNFSWGISFPDKPGICMYLCKYEGFRFL